MQPRARLHARSLMSPRALAYFYSRRLRVHTVQELLAGLGVAIAVALVFAVTVAGSSITSSAGEVVHTLVGRATLQLRARDDEGVDEHVLADVERLPGVAKAAPLLEQTGTLVAPDGRRVTVELAGTNVSLALLDGLAHTLPLAALAPGGIGLSRASAAALGLRSASTRGVRVEVRGSAYRLAVSAVLGTETFGALSRALVAVMPLEQMQSLAHLPGRITRVLVAVRPGHEAAVAVELQRLARGRLTVARSDADVALLRQALRPSDQANALFAAIGALLGFLFAFNAMLLTVPERRQVIVELRLVGTRRAAIVQMVLFQAFCLGVVASLVGLLAGYALSLGAFHQSPGYLQQAFTLGTSTVVGLRPVLLALAGGILATCLASVVPLLDLRRGRPVDAADFAQGAPGNALADSARGLLAAAALGLFVLASVLLVLFPAAAIGACVALALATLLAVPAAFAAVLRLAGFVARRMQRLTVLPLALASLRATTVRSLALAATGAVALFGSVALGGARSDLLRGIDGYTSHYVAAADIWIANPRDNQAIDSFAFGADAARLARVPVVARTHLFQGSFLDFGDRRVWVIAWPRDVEPSLLDGQLLAGRAQNTASRLRSAGWITVSRQIAAEHGVGVGDTLRLPTPTGTVAFRVAATTTDFGWSPGAIVMNTADYARAWGTTAPSSVGVELVPGADVSAARRAIERALGPRSGLEVLSAGARERRIDSSAAEGLSQLGEISTLLVLAAILAMAAALGSSVWQRRTALAGLRLTGARPGRLRRILLVESALMLSAGCLTGALAGVYGQLVIDRYLERVTGFPVTSAITALLPLEILALVVASVLAVVAIPAWWASRVSPTLALDE